MPFKGDLSTIGLGEVFQMISMSQKEGTLIVQDSDSRKCVFFGVSGVQLLSSGRRKGMKVGDMLLRAGKVTEGQLEDALENGRIQKKKVGEVLVESGVVSEDEVKQIVREQIEEEIYDLFLWKKADFEFVEGPAAEELKDPEAQVTQLSFDVNGLLLEAVRRADEWAVINQSIPSIDSIFTFVSESDRHEEDKSAPDASKRVYRLIDGRIPISEIVENIGVSKFDVCKVLVDLYNRGRIRLLTVPETMELAVKRMSESGGRERGMRMYLAAAAQAPTDAKVLSQVAKFLEGEGLGKEASTYHVKAGRIFMELGDLDRAMDHMQRAAAANPDDPQIMMGLFEVHAAAGNLEEGKKLAKILVAQALMTPDLPRSRALCDRILNADPADMEFRVYRAKTLHRSNLKKELAEDLDYIKKNMPVDQNEAEKIERELREILVKRPSSVHPKPQSGSAAPPRTKGGRSKLPLVAALLLLVGAAGAAGYYEMTAKKDLDLEMEAARDYAADFKFSKAREGIDRFIEKNFSPKQKDRARAFLRELEAKQSTWEKDKKDRADAERREALERMKALLIVIEDDRQNRPANALQKAHELRDFAEKNKDQEYMKKAEELAQALEKYLGEALNLKTRADGLEKEGKLRDAALLIDKLLTEFPNTDPARYALYPIEIATRPEGVKVTSVRSGIQLGLTGAAPLRYRMKPTEAVRLLFEKQGYASVERDVKDKSVGRIQVELTEKREQWILPLGVSVSSPPLVMGDSVLVAGGSRLFAVRTNPKRMDWFEPFDGPIEGGPKLAGERVYVGTSSNGLYAIDPRAKEKRQLWRYDAGDRVGGTPGVSSDGATVYVGTIDRSLHAVRASSGEFIWKREMPAEVRVEPLAMDALMIVACSDGTLIGLKGARPEDEVWRFRMDGAPGPMTLTDGRLYVSGSDNTLYALDPLKGTKLWSRVLSSMVTGRVACVNGTVCAALREGKVHFLTAATGAPQLTFEASGPIQGGVSVSGTLVLFGSDDQYVYAFDLSLRSLAWRLKVKGRVKLAPAAGNAAAYIGNDEGLYAVELN
ncbi:MAG: PQQ-binding-like beta-propeller repeat protein [Planctomycetes bacterium]|nr:PQQ-binding-like beta-propeller repeat protein [Planctomycetota bacterium]